MHGLFYMTPDLPCAPVNDDYTSLPAEKGGKVVGSPSTSVLGRNGEYDFVAGVSLLHWTSFYKFHIRY